MHSCLYSSLVKLRPDGIFFLKVFRISYNNLYELKNLIASNFLDFYLLYFYSETCGSFMLDVIKPCIRI